MAERNKLRKRLQVLSHERETWITVKATLTMKNAALVKQLRDTQNELQSYKDSGQNSSAGGHGNIGFIASGQVAPRHIESQEGEKVDDRETIESAELAGAARGEPHENEVVAQARPLGLTSNEEIAPDNASRASSAGDVPMPTTSSVADSEPPKSLDDKEFQRRHPKREYLLAGYAEPSTQTDTTTIPGPSSDAHAEPAEGSKSRWPSIVDEPVKKDAQSPSKESAMTGASEGSSSTTASPHDQLISSDIVPSEHADFYLKHTQDDVETAPNLYSDDIESPYGYLDCAEVPVRWRSRMLEQEHNNPHAALDLWGKIEHQVEHLNLMGRSDDGAWSILRAADFDYDAVLQRLSNDAKSAQRRVHDTVLEEELAEEGEEVDEDDDDDDNHGSGSE